MVMKTILLCAATTFVISISTGALAAETTKIPMVPAIKVLPDIFPKQTGSFGKKTFDGNAMVVTKNDATSLRNNTCIFKMGFGVHATADTLKPFTVLVFVKPNIHPIAEIKNQRMTQRHTESHFVEVKLKPVILPAGEPSIPKKQRIAIYTDTNKEINESSERNNNVQFDVTLNGDCRSSSVNTPLKTPKVQLK